MTPQFRKFHRQRSHSVVSLVLVVTLALGAQAQDANPTPRTVTLKQGQILEMASVQRVNSGHATVGDAVVLKLTKPLMADGATVLPTNWPVYGRVTEVKRAGKNCQPGSIHWELEPVALADGKKIEIHPIANLVAARRLRDQAEQGAPAARAGGRTTEKKDSRARSIVDIALLPVAIVAVSLLLLSEIKYGDEACRGGKGREESIPKGRPFYAEISQDSQQAVD